MHRRSFPSGQASTAMLKALWRALSRDHGAAAADAWLRGIRMEPDDLEDETRTIPLATLHAALARFVERTGTRDAVPSLWRELVVPDQMGVWVRVLRGTSAPSEAFARLDSTDSEYGRTTRWETIEGGRASWRGRVVILHDPSLEEDGLLRLARLAELAAVPALFGYAGATARARGDDAPGSSRAGAIVQDFEVS